MPTNKEIEAINARIFVEKCRAINAPAIQATREQQEAINAIARGNANSDSYQLRDGTKADDDADADDDDD